jgi:hypothetical protein
MSNKEIIALNDFEHVLLRPTIYIGSVEKSEEKLVLIREGKVIQDIKEISVGFYKLMIEILDNAFDEAKRMKGEMEKIEIYFDTVTNTVKVTDSGGGFLNASKINAKTGISNVASAMSMLRAGSNFKNSATQENLIGTNGVGASIVNMLSDQFTIKTVNSVESYSQTWRKFEAQKAKIEKNKGINTGTEVVFTPRKDIFKDCAWDREYVYSMMIFREFLKKTDPVISKLEFNCYFDDEKLDLEVNFLPEEHFVANTKQGSVYIWESFSKSCSTSFVNGAICGGIHQRIIGEWIDEAFGTQSAGKFYETFIVLNLPPNLVRFGDQNKTRFVTSRGQVNPLLEKFFMNPIKKTLKHNVIYGSILKKVEESEREANVRNLRNTKRAQKHKISDKYFPPSAKTRNLFIVEGGCIDENQSILVLNENGIEDKLLKEISLDDSVLTHNHRWRKVENFSKKISKGVRIKIGDEFLDSGASHPWFVYDTNDDKFYFLEAEKIDPKIHKLVKNRLRNFSHVEEILKIESTTDEKFPLRITFESSNQQKVSLSHKFCIYNEKENTFQMKESQTLREGEFVAVFSDL